MGRPYLKAKERRIFFSNLDVLYRIGWVGVRAIITRGIMSGGAHTPTQHSFPTCPGEHVGQFFHVRSGSLTPVCSTFPLHSSLLILLTISIRSNIQRPTPQHDLDVNRITTNTVVVCRHPRLIRFLTKNLITLVVNRNGRWKKMFWNNLYHFIFSS